MFRLPTDVGSTLAGGGTLLVPSRQRAHAVKLAHAAAHLDSGRRVWASADVLTPAAWVRRECERRAELAPGDWPRILRPTEEWLLWREAARDAAGDHPFLEPGTLAEGLQRASDRSAEYGFRPGAGEPGTEAALLERAQRLFEARCRELGAASAAGLTPRLREGPGDTRTPLVRGFGALPPLLASFADPGGARRAAALARAIRVPDKQSELEAITAWCRARLSAQPDARLLVMLPGPAGVRARLAALVHSILDPGALFSTSDSRAPVGIEGGEPFGQHPLASQALAGLALLAGTERDANAVSDWLTAASWGRPAPAPRAALGLLVRDRGLVRIDLRELLAFLQLVPRALRPAARELDGLLRRAAAALGKGNCSAQRWSERIDRALAALGWPGALAQGSGLHQARLRWQELLDEFGELDNCLPGLGCEQAIELLRALALRTRWRPGDEGAPVTISPVLADPVVIYDGIWVGSLSADVLPAPVAPDPYLSLPAQLAAGVPEASPAGRRAQAQALLAAWRCGADELVLSVPARDEDMELLPSPYLAGIELVDEVPPNLWLAHRLHRAGCTEEVADARGTSFNNQKPLTGGTRALTLQNLCPFRAYAELRLGAVAAEEAEPGVPANQRGLLLHAALQLLWERLRDSSALAALDAPALDLLIEECVRAGARALQVELRGGRRRVRRLPDGQFDLFSALSPALERECMRAQSLIRRLCDVERTRAPFTVESTEQTTQLTLAGGRIVMRPDRVDRIPGGRAVLDYKSGAPGSPDWLGERPTHPQLLAYLAMLGSDVVALATVHLTAREIRFKGTAAAPRLLPMVKALPGAAGAAPDWAGQQRAWVALIERLVRAFLDGEARVAPAPGACDYCHLKDVCRISPHRSPEPAAFADETDE